MRLASVWKSLAVSLTCPASFSWTSRRVRLWTLPSAFNTTCQVQQSQSARGLSYPENYQSGSAVIWQEGLTCTAHRLSGSTESVTKVVGFTFPAQHLSECEALSVFISQTPPVGLNSVSKHTGFCDHRWLGPTGFYFPDHSLPASGESEKIMVVFFLSLIQCDNFFNHARNQERS